MILKVGDVVEVKKSLTTTKKYGSLRPNDVMVNLKGRKVTINKVNETDYNIIEDNEEWYWNDEMFTKKSIEEAVANSTEIEIGDCVKVKEEDIRYVSSFMCLSKSIKDVKGILKKGKTTSGTFIEFEENLGLHNANGDGQDGHCYYFNLEFIRKYFKKVKKEEFVFVTEVIETKDDESIELTKKLIASVDNLSKKVNQQDPFKQAMIEAIIEKGKDLAIEDLKDRLKDQLDDYIEKTYGCLPKKFVIENNGVKKEITGIFHKQFENICSIVNKNIPVMLVGPAGAGKNYTLEQVAQALDLPFYFTNAITQEFKLTGFIDANGVYQETQFYKAFKNGGVFFLDEVDASVPEALIILNSAIANRYFDFPIGKVEAHKDFRVVCAGNTYGTGADMVYVGRNVLDGATLDRFVVIDFDYDEEVEKKLSYDEELYNFIIDLRKAIKDSSLRYIISMRAIINASKLLEIGMPKEDIIKIAIIKNMQIDDLNVIVRKLKDSNWAKEFKHIVGV